MKRNDSNRRRGRPPSSQQRKPLTPQEPPQKSQAVQPEKSPDLMELWLPVLHEQVLEEGTPVNFSTLLIHILRSDRAEVVRLAQELGVSEPTVLRWMNGTVRPRQAHLKKLLEVMPEHADNLIHAIKHTYPDAMEALLPGAKELSSDIYRRVMELVASTGNAETLTWHVAYTVFEHALMHLDADRQGISLTFAKFMPAYEDGIHSLYEAFASGTYPWSSELTTPAYLGSNSLAGAAAIGQRWLTWDDLDPVDRLRVTIDDFERSACACPIMLHGEMGGVLVLSSTSTGFFADKVTRRTVIEYAQLLGLSLSSHELKYQSELNLQPMPPLIWQRAELNRTYKNRVLKYARAHGCSSVDAEQEVRREVERSFEQEARKLPLHGREKVNDILPQPTKQVKKEL